MSQKATRYLPICTTYRMAEAKAVIGIDLGATTW